MVMLRPKGKAYAVAKSVLEKKGIKVRKPSSMEKTTISSPYLQH
jgi:hypothetical protein